MGNHELRDDFERLIADVAGKLDSAPICRLFDLVQTSPQSWELSTLILEDVNEMIPCRSLERYT